MLTWLKELDRILRGEATRPAELRRGTLEVLEQELAVGIVILGAIYGACVGCFALVSRDEPEFRQLLASTFKVPALFCLTLVITFPSLYVFSALVGSRLTMVPMLRLLIAALSVLLAVLASLGPIVAFFSVTTTSYSFILFLNVAVFTVASVLGLGFLLKTLHRLSLIGAETMDEVPVSDDPASAGAAEPAPPRPPPGPPQHGPAPVLSPQARFVFYIWVLVFTLVAAQMAWVLRPFVGDPKQPFVLFRHFDVSQQRGNSHVFQGLWRVLFNLFSEPENDLPDSRRSRAPLPDSGRTERAGPDHTSADRLRHSRWSLLRSIDGDLWRPGRRSALAGALHRYQSASFDPGDIRPDAAVLLRHQHAGRLAG
jgi:hypothetical protein